MASLFALSIVFLYPRVSSQIEVLEVELPKAAQDVKSKLSNNKVGNLVLNEVGRYKGELKKNKEQLTIFFSSFLGGLADLYIVVFLGMFLMVQPSLYINGIITLFPKPKRKRTEEVLLTMGYTLKRWLLGKIFSMLIVGVLTCTGLAILGVPLALTLGIFAALITFIPNFGPIFSLIPAFLLALTMGENYAFYVVLLYGGIQIVESNILTPLIQKKMIAFPLAMILVAQVILGIFTGMLGLILAVPVIAILMVFVKMVYVEDILGDRSITVMGEELFVDDNDSTAEESHSANVEVE